MKLLYRLLSFLLLLGIASKYSTASFFQKDICDLIKDNTTDFSLQGMFVGSNDLCIIVDDNLYRIPKVNLDQTNQVLKMFDREGKLYGSEKWYEHANTKFAVREPKEGEEKRYREKHSAKTLKLYNELIWTGDGLSSDKRYLRSYHFIDDTQFLFRENDQIMPMDTLRDCDKDDKTDICYPWHRHSMFHAVIDGIDQGYIFYYDQVDSRANNRKRVLVGALRDVNGLDDYDKFNLPEDNAKDDTVKGQRNGYNLKINGYDRKSMKIVLNTDSSNKDDADPQTDYFKYLPFGFIINDTVYLVSLARKRVYFTKYEPLDSIKNFEMKSKPLKEFFICDQSTVIPLESTDATDETDQADYLSWASKFNPDAVEAIPMGWISSVLSEPTKLAWLLIVALVCGMACCCYVNRYNKKKHHDMKRILYDKQGKPVRATFPKKQMQLQPQLNKKVNPVPKKNMQPKAADNSLATKSLALFGQDSSSASSSTALSTGGNSATLRTTSDSRR